MPNYYIRADGLSRTKEQLMNMLANQEYPQNFSIVGVIDEQNPQSQSWYFRKTFNAFGEGYSFNQQQVVFHGLPAIGANQFADIEGIAGLVEECIEYFGPDAVAVNAPPLPQEDDLFPLPEAALGAPAVNDVGAGNAAPPANAAPFAPMNENHNNMFIEGWGGMGAQPQAGGRRRPQRKRSQRKRSQRRRMTKRRSLQRRRRF
jgi:hypothetical protein